MTEFQDKYVFPVSKTGRDKFRDSLISFGQKGIFVDIVASHAGRMTANYAVYDADSMKECAPSWITPYNKPVLIHHYDFVDPIGRVVDVAFVPAPRTNPFSTDSAVTTPETAGTGHLRLRAHITDQKAIEKIADKRYLTVSVEFSSKKAICSICKKNQADRKSTCSHNRGMDYEDQVCYVNVYDFSYKEISFINFPADDYATVVGISDAEDTYSENTITSADGDDSPVFQLWDAVAPMPTSSVYKHSDGPAGGSHRHTTAKPTGDHSHKEGDKPGHHIHDMSNALGQHKHGETDDSWYGTHIHTAEYPDGMHVHPEHTRDASTEELEDLVISQYIVQNMEDEFEAMISESVITTTDITVDAKLNTERRKSLPDSSFCGPGRSFPVPDKCVRKGTLVKLLDGRDRPVEDLVDDNDVWVYGFDLKKMAVVPAKVSRVWKTLDNAKIIRVTLDNGEFVDCTENHPFLLRDGKYCQADQLKINDSLMPLYHSYRSLRGTGKDYEVIYQPRYKIWESTHRVVSREVEGRPLGDDEVVRHIDNNQKNNHPNNLQILSRSEHKLTKIGNAAQSNTGRAIDSLHEEFLDGKSVVALSKKYGVDRETLSARFKNAGFDLDPIAGKLAKQGKSIADIYNEWQSGEVTLEELSRNIGFKSERIRSRFSSLLEQPVANHRVASIEEVGFDEVYDLEVPGVHNFALSAGIFVHNSHVTAALRLLGRYKGPGSKARIRACVMRKAKRMGMDVGKDSCSGDLSSLYDSSPLWIEFRREIISERNGKCELCGKDAIDIHHIIPFKLNQNLRDNLAVLCTDCHRDADNFILTYGEDEIRERMKGGALADALLLYTGYDGPGDLSVLIKSKIGSAPGANEKTITDKESDTVKEQTRTVEELEVVNKALTDRVGVLDKENATLKDELKVLRENKSEILDRANDLEKRLLQQLAERVFDIRVTLNKNDIRDFITADATKKDDLRKTHLSRFMDRSIESLTDSITDLNSELEGRAGTTHDPENTLPGGGPPVRDNAGGGNRSDKKNVFES